MYICPNKSYIVNVKLRVHVSTVTSFPLSVAAIDGLRTLDSVIETPHSLVIVLGFLAATQWTSIFIIPLIQVSRLECDLLLGCKSLYLHLMKSGHFILIHVAKIFPWRIFSPMLLHALIVEIVQWLYIILWYVLKQHPVLQKGLVLKIT